MSWKEKSLAAGVVTDVLALRFINGGKGIKKSHPPRSCENNEKGMLHALEGGGGAQGLCIASPLTSPTSDLYAIWSWLGRAVSSLCPSSLILNLLMFEHLNDISVHVQFLRKIYCFCIDFVVHKYSGFRFEKHCVLLGL